MTPTIQRRRHGAAEVITLDEPRRRNVLSMDTMTALTAAIRDAGAGDARAIVLAATGPAFSAGHALDEIAGATREQADELFATCETMLAAIGAVPQPVIARVHGLATAAGCQLVATCDLAVAGESARFALSGCKVGFFCHTPLVAVAHTIGRKRALEMALTGDPIDAHTAAAWGLINHVVADDELDDQVDDLVGRCCQASAAANGIGKHTFYRQVDLPVGEAYAVATPVMAQAAVSDDAQAGIDAFLHRRR